jgi:hypothetical protein
MKPVLTTLAAAAALSACAALDLGSRRLSRSPEFPAASGTVSFRRGGDGDTGIDLRVRHMAEPDRLVPPGYVYVAWVRGGAEVPPQNLGVLELDADRGAALRAATSLRRFTLFVTAESARDGAAPAGPPLLWASRD